ncbi:ImmA/IrrE family metallo-endopeptidase [Methylorubrum sp. Q1]|uniref:ImmA/IrrE family metallo-endopeptidase n=1 Tax=Methylorubrum sp. Q1 TaxID=2562453 RepID=UPI001075E3D2|nr:ImmA/IrrE family metallo-endopeptidase [Methylorubrum sp. Q1]TFZ57131.1 ImmA/IrrE family metallo-endopeptidase [Methylorubrum sp. Q1]
MPVSAQMGPLRRANQLTQLLDLTKGLDRYPVDVEQLAREYSRATAADDPIQDIVTEPLKGFEGALVPLRADPGGWLIVSNVLATPGRRRFTVAHEFAHWVLHRHLLPPEGIYCSEEDVSRRNGEDIEKEADTFAAALLMPLHDLRRQIDPRAKPTLADLGALADRYGVSLMAATLRWLEITERRSLMVVSTEGYALWARSSDPAFKSGRFIRTSGPPHEIPAAAGAMRPDLSSECRAGITHPPGVWFDEEVEEFTVHAITFEKVITVLHLGDARPLWRTVEEEHEPDVIDRFRL